METSNKIFNEELLCDAGVLNTNIGTQLIDNFSKVDPEKACAYMTKAFEKMSLEELSKIYEYRAGLCWTLSRLCFNRNTFVEASELMLRFALSEQGGDLQTGQMGLNKLFYPRLGATEADLNTRLKFVRNHVIHNEELWVMWSVLGCCLTFQSVFFHDGTEKLADRIMTCYDPKDEEIGNYVGGIIGLIDVLLSKEDGEIRDKAIDILENHFIELCRCGFAGKILPILEKVCELKQNSWDSLLDKLLLFHDSLKTEIQPEQLSQYEEIMTRLKKNDFESRFKRVEKELYSSPFRFSTEKLILEQRNRYKKLGEEFCQRGLFSKEMLESLYDAEVISTSPFGMELAKGLSMGQRDFFVEYSIEILNRREKSQNDILVDFTCGLSDDEFGITFEKLQTLKIKCLVFAATARRSTSFDNSYMNSLVDMVKSGVATHDCFITYWSNFGFIHMRDDDIANWMLRIRELPNGENAVLHILQSAINGEAYNKMPHTVEVATDTVMRMSVDYDTIMRFYQFWNVVRLLLIKGNNPELAQRINELLLEYVRRQDGVFLNNYEISQTYSLLLTKYFDAIWERLSMALLVDDDDVWTFFRIKEILGSMIGGIHNEQGLLFEQDHTEALLAWCRKNPDTAPERLMDMAPVFDENGGFSKIVLILIDEFGQNPRVLNALRHNLGCFSIIGSAKVLYEKQIKAIEALRSHRYPEVQAWSENMILNLNKEIEEEEKGWKY